MRRARIHFLLVTLATACLTACAAGPTPTATVIRTLHNVQADHLGFANMLIVCVTGDYETRAAMERGLASQFADYESLATAYHTVVGRRPHLDRSTLENAILARQFDAILLIRESGQEREALVPGRPVGRAFDLFGYDYPELNGAASIEQAATISFVTELYSVATRRKIWSIDTLSFDKNTAAELIDEQVITIAQQIAADRLLRP